MSDFHVRSDAVDVEQIMRQIRARIREKRGADYTEAELQQLATVKLEKFLDPRGVRSDLVDAFRRQRVVSPDPPTYEFEDTTLYDTHRGLLRTIRRLLHPILKLFINPGPLVQALHTQKQINAEFHRRFRQREDMDPLYYEVVHNLVLEITRAGIEVHNLKMRVESLSSRLDFDERRARSLENVVQYRPARPAASPAPSRRQNTQPSYGQVISQDPTPLATAPPAAAAPAPQSPSSAAPNGGPAGHTQGAQADGVSSERRRRRRRRRRRSGPNAAASAPGGPTGLGGSPAGMTPADHGGSPSDAGPDDGDDGGDDEAADQ